MELKHKWTQRLQNSLFHSIQNSFQPPLSILVGLDDMEPKLIYPMLAMINIVTKWILIS